jgi:hypothetical protein
MIKIENLKAYEITPSNLVKAARECVDRGLSLTIDGDAIPHGWLVGLVDIKYARVFLQDYKRWLANAGRSLEQ